MDSRLKGRTVVVTGASSGIGRAMAIKFANAGARVVCADLSPASRASARNDEAREPTHEAINRARAPEEAARHVRCDVTDEDSVRALVAAAVAWTGRVDVMCNNAGVSPEAQGASASAPAPRLHETPTAHFDAAVAVNVRGVWLGCKHAIAQMLRQEPLPANARGERTRGRVVNTASIYGLVGAPGSSCYTATKHAVVGLTKQAAIDYAPDRIHVNCVCPGFVQSALIENLVSAPEQRAGIDALHPWGSIGRTEDVADAALFLASDEALWMTGHSLVVDGGYTAQ